MKRIIALLGALAIIAGLGFMATPAGATQVGSTSSFSIQPLNAAGKPVAAAAGVGAQPQVRAGCSSSNWIQIRSSNVVDCFNGPGYDNVQLPQTDLYENSTKHGKTEIAYYHCSNYTQTPGCSNTLYRYCIPSGQIGTAAGIDGQAYIDVVNITYNAAC